MALLSWLKNRVSNQLLFPEYAAPSYINLYLRGKKPLDYSTEIDVVITVRKFSFFFINLYDVDWLCADSIESADHKILFCETKIGGLAYKVWLIKNLKLVLRLRSSLIHASLACNLVKRYSIN